MGQIVDHVKNINIYSITTGVVPHVGGPILPPGGSTALIGGLPAAGVGDIAVRVGPPCDRPGQFTTLIRGQPAARMSDMTAYGGSIVVGLPTVLIG